MEDSPKDPPRSHYLLSASPEHSRTSDKQYSHSRLWGSLASPTAFVKKKFDKTYNRSGKPAKSAARKHLQT
jgi:hypothetical protein